MIELPDGIHVRLRDARYFEQPRLGSTDLVTLHNRPADWFYGSRLNPFRAEPEPSDEMQFGSALHVLLLEGEDAYTARVVVKPSTYIDPKTGEEKKWNGNANVCKAWSDENERPDAIVLTEDASRRVRHMAMLIRNHPELGPAMAGGMSEVSILWTNDRGVKLRARFDKLLPRFLIDLKSFGGDARGLTMTQQCMGLVASRHMDVQRYIYFQARMQMARLLAEGAVFGATDEERDWLAKVAALEEFRWCWIFYRRRDDARGHAPIVKPIYRSHLDTSFETGRQKVEVALANYQTFMDRFGADVPWAVIEAAEEPADHEFPSWLRDVPPPVTLPDLEKDAA